MVAAVLVAGASTLSAQQKCPAVEKGVNMPLKYAGAPTVTAITACDLMTRLYIYADDSMLGREAGSPNNIRATEYIEKQVRSWGLKPGGDNGTFFQYLPVFSRVVDTGSVMLMSGNAMFKFSIDFTAGAADVNLPATQVIYGGVQGDTANPISPDVIKGKIVLVKPNPQQGAGGGRGQIALTAVPAGAAGATAGGRGANRGGQNGFANPFAGAAAVFTIVGDQLATQGGRGGGGRGGVQFIDSVQTAGAAAFAAANPPAGPGGGRAGGGRGGAGGAQAPAATITTKVAQALLGKPVDQATKGDLGQTASFTMKAKMIPAPTRNVIAILPGSDAKLRNEYIVIGAHSDHNPPNNNPVESDSLKAYNMIARVEGADSRGGAPPTAEQWVRINAIKDSLRKVYPARLDSISNGADDDGSGSVSVLEIAEAFAKGSVKPKRSLIFIWQVGEEKGLWGSQWFTNHPTTMSRDSIVADLNLDMVGRGAATDVTGQAADGGHLHGAENYLQLVGSRRLSTELGDIVEQVNKDKNYGFTFDYGMDANGHPQNIYCRSDHANYARYGIPVVFFTTGGHADYHQVTDEPQYIQYQHMAKVDQLVFDIAVKVGNLDHAVVVDKQKQASPFGRCQQ